MATKITWCEKESKITTYSCILTEEEEKLYNEGHEMFEELHGSFYRECESIIEDEDFDYEDPYNIDSIEISTTDNWCHYSGMPNPQAYTTTPTKE